MNVVVAQSDNGSANSSARSDAVTSLQIAQHRLPLLLPALLGKNQKEIEDQENEYQGSPRQPTGTATCGRLKHKCTQRLHLHDFHMATTHTGSPESLELMLYLPIVPAGTDSDRPP